MHHEFDRISIESLSKKDLLIILEALDYSFTHTKIEEFASLKNAITLDLQSLLDVNTEDQLTALLMEE